MLEKITIYIRQGMAYIPTEAKLVGDGAGIILTVEPVYTGTATLEFILQTIESMMAAGHPNIPTPKIIGSTASERPVLKAARVHSYRKLVQGAIMYTITWRLDEVMLSASIPSNKGGWFDIESGPEWRFPPSVTLRFLAEVILEDARTRPELLIPTSEV